MKRRQPIQEHAHWLEPMYGLQVLVADPEKPPIHEHPDAHTWFAEVRLQQSAPDRLQIVGVHMKALPGYFIDVDTWRRFPAAKVETTVNVDYLRRLLLEHEGSVPPGQDPSLSAEARERAKTQPLPMGNLKPPTGRRYPDDFYQKVADAYRFHVQHGKNPAQRMSDDYGVPITTVNRWVKEARRRNILLPARSQGRAG